MIPLICFSFAYGISKYSIQLYLPEQVTTDEWLLDWLPAVRQTFFSSDIRQRTVALLIKCLVQNNKMSQSFYTVSAVWL
jgi:hypothetical protein